MKEGETIVVAARFAAMLINLPQLSSVGNTILAGEKIDATMRWGNGRTLLAFTYLHSGQSLLSLPNANLDCRFLRFKVIDDQAQFIFARREI